VAGVADSPRQPTAASSPPQASPPRHEASARKQRRAAPEEQATPDPATVVAPQPDPPADLQPPAKPAAELQFQEPVRRVVSGDQVITLRRLTPEEKASRTARRNIVMMIAGVSILMAIVLIFGTKRSKPRN
jgi:hypothetical protein